MQNSQLDKHLDFGFMVQCFYHSGGKQNFSYNYDIAFISVVLKFLFVFIHLLYRGPLIFSIY